MRWREMAFLVLGFFATSQAVCEEPRKAMVYGAGNFSCGVWLQERGKPDGGDSSVLFSWALGYMTAAEVLFGFIHADTDRAGMAAFLDQYCRQNPLSKYGLAVAQLSLSLGEKYNQEIDSKIKALRDSLNSK